MQDEDLDRITLTNVSCEELLNEVDWRDARVIVSLVILAIINLVVILGNCLVILAVFISTKLRTVTNLFIVSLAVADLMVGVAVLPFSATFEIFEVWIFGELWCSAWLALDVWMCTASILNLCAISLDRYVAVTRPVTYPSIMSPKKAKILIAIVWVLSFLICFPPLVGWNDRKRTFYRSLANSTISSYQTLGPYDTTPLPGEEEETGPLYHMEECALTCELTNDKGYVVYSAIGSFYLPMFVMLFFYWRIYRAAVETTRAINQGFRTTKATRLLGSRFEEQRLTLRIHRGRSVQKPTDSPIPNTPSTGGSTVMTDDSNTSTPLNGRQSTSGSRLARSRSQEKFKVHLTPPPRGRRSASLKPRNMGNFSPSRRSTASTSPSSCGSPMASRVETLSIPVERRRGSESETSTPSPTASKYEGEEKPKLISKMGKRNIKAQVKRFRMETKAAKTLGIIVGGFILCWLPFFTMYVLRAFCPTCIPPLLFSVLFWLGYCNSALNPCIYALFSKDFRFAFKKIICRCVCQTEKKPQLTVVPIFLSSMGDESEHLQDHDQESQVAPRSAPTRRANLPSCRSEARV